MKSPSVVTVGDPDVVPEYAVVLTRRITTPEPPLAFAVGAWYLPPPPPPVLMAPEAYPLGESLDSGAP